MLWPRLSKVCIRAGGTGRAGGPWPPTFLRREKKKRRQRKKRKGFKARLSSRSKYYCFSHSRVSRIRKFFLSANHGGRKYISVFHGLPTLKFISMALCMWKKNEILRLCVEHVCPVVYLSFAENALGQRLNLDNYSVLSTWLCADNF